MTLLDKEQKDRRSDELGDSPVKRERSVFNPAKVRNRETPTSKPKSGGEGTQKKSQADDKQALVDKINDSVQLGKSPVSVSSASPEPRFDDPKLDRSFQEFRKAAQKLTDVEEGE